MSLSLNALPPELISCVVANIASQTTLCNLAQCSRRLHLCTIPHLYRHVTIWETAKEREQQTGQLRTLASLLIRRPDLAGLVRQFTLRVTERFKRVAFFDQESVKRASTTITSALSLSSEEKINCIRRFSPTHNSHYDLILALLLPALLKVEKLVLDLDIAWDTCYLEHMMRRAASREKPFDIRPPFESLTVFVQSHERFSARSTGFIAALLKLPAIQEISGGFEKRWDDVDDRLSKVIPFDKNLKDLYSSSSPVTSLDLVVYALSTADLGHILRAPKALKTLCYKVCSPACINFTEVRHALGPQENCLKSLSLDSDEACDETNALFRPMPSFISFNTLKVFKTGAIFLTTADNGVERHGLIDIFPPSLEMLHLTRFHSCFESLLEALEHLLAQKSPQQIPSLKRLKLDETDSFIPMLGPMFGARHVKLMDVLWRGTQETATWRLMRVGAAQGVTVKVVEERIDKWEINESAE
ncbi:hypothetical protein MMC22_005354 [Lobaria immixta]|nr:hypothetical protein [Lobaria immixta]